MTSETILERLRLRHSDDVFVAELPSRAGIYAMGRLDAWAMKRAWTNPCTFGYEIKVSRSDFVRDDKWQSYLGSCNQFYFVCPAKLIAPEEVPEIAGLLWASISGTRLMTRKKAAHREIDSLEDIYKSILMNRAGIVSPREAHGAVRDAAYWCQWLKEKKTSAIYGRELRGKLRGIVEEQLQKTRNENDRLRSENAALAEFRDLAERIGLSPKYHRPSEAEVRRAMLPIISGDLLPILLRTTQSIAEAIRLLNALIGKDGATE